MPKNPTKPTKSVSSSFVNTARRRKRQKIVFTILTVVLAFGLIGSSMFWAFDRNNVPVDTGTGDAGQSPKVSVDEKIAELEGQLKDAPEDTGLMGELAGLYWQSGKPNQAVEYYLKALDLKPEDDKLHKDLASTYYLMGEYENAVKQAEKAIQQDNKDAEAHYLLGQFYAYRSDGKQDIEKGIQELEQFIKLQKDGIDVEKARQMIEELKTEK